MNEDIEDEIRQRAHKIWLEAGCPEGEAKKHWDIAELALMREHASPDKPESDPHAGLPKLGEE
jgi:hypothetical protein